MPPRTTRYGARTVRKSNARIIDEMPIGPTHIQSTDQDEDYYVESAPSRVFSKVVYGARFPTPASSDIMKLVKTNRGVNRVPTKIRSAAIVNFNGEEALQLRDPYATPYVKSRIEDSYRLDPIVRRSVNAIAKFTLGKRVNVVVDTPEEFIDSRIDSDKVHTQAKAKATGIRQAAHTTVMDISTPEDPNHGFLTDQEAINLKGTIEHVHRRVKFHQKLQAAVIQAKVGGRAAILIEGKDEDGLPLDLKVLNWRKLGTVYADPDTWALKAVEYQDRNKDDPLRPEEMIYLTNQDFHVSPDTLYYGLSEIETVMHVSEANRLLDEEDFKEANRALWAHHGLIKFPPNVTDDEIDEFLDNFYPGTWNGTSQDVIVETHNLNINMNEFVHERNENDKRILRGMGVPAFLVGFEDVTNRATTVAVLHAWRESELNDYRTWLQNSLEPQWLDMLAEAIYPDKNWANMRMKPRLEFEDITFESLKEKSDAVIPLFQAGLISTHKALELLDMHDELEHLISIDEEIKETRKTDLLVRERAMMRNVKLQQQGGQNFGQRSPSKSIPHDAGTATQNIDAGNASTRGASAKKDKTRKPRK